ncbi:MAG: septation protein A [Burkholderiaceae bacterium]|nr:septation protein A [Burkholderiaceae bacterium]
MKLLFDLFPVVLFFVAYKVADIYVATGVAIVASIGQIGWLLARRKRVEAMQWTSLAIIVLFGGLTLVLQDETFIKWKPTVLYGLFALVLAGAQFAFRRNLIRAAMGGKIALPDAVWSRLNAVWVAFFLAMAALNLFVAYRFPTETWVEFKLFGTTGLTLAFVLVQALYVGRHVQEESQ